MPSTKPVALCTQLLPSGKLCRGIALRGQHYCRAHIRNYRLLERDRQHDQAMFNLSVQLEAMDIPQLLETLHAKLDGITSIVRAYPEARLTLAFTLNLLRQINHPAPDLNDPQPTSTESRISPQLQQNQQLTTAIPPHFNEINQMLTSNPESNT